MLPISRHELPRVIRRLPFFNINLPLKIYRARGVIPFNSDVPDTDSGTKLAGVHHSLKTAVPAERGRREVVARREEFHHRDRTQPSYPRDWDRLWNEIKKKTILLALVWKRPTILLPRPRLVLGLWSLVLLAPWGRWWPPRGSSSRRRSCARARSSKPPGVPTAKSAGRATTYNSYSAGCDTMRSTSAR
jgi:hypothetical protein